MLPLGIMKNSKENYMKKILFTSVAVVLLLMLTVFSVMADPAATATAAVSADVTSVDRGGTVTVTVTLADCVDLKSGGIEMVYDTDVLEAVSGVLSYAQAGSAMVFGEFDVAESVAVFFCTGMNNTPKAANFNGDLLTVTFKVKDTAAYGTTEISCVAQPVDANGQDVACTTTQVATLTVACAHADIVPKEESPSTCKEQGHAAGIYCNDCLSYIAGGDPLPEVPHTYVGQYDGWGYKGSQIHERECTVCHEIEQEPHSYSEWRPNTETGEHEKICAGCGDGESEQHVFEAQIATDEYLATPASCTEQATYYYSCNDCGLAGKETFSAGALLPHTCDLKVEDALYKVSGADCLNGTVYYKSCVCGEVGTETFEAADALGHDFDTKYSSDADGHYYACLRTGCGARDDEEPHHGGTASCTDRALCDDCLQPYGDTTDHSYDQKIGDAQYKVNDADCLNGTVYYKSCVCGEAGTETFEAADALDHDFAKTYSYGADGHYYACLRTGCDARDDEEPHHGGTASCTEQAVCDDCLQSYGALLEHTYDRREVDTAYLVSGADCTHAAVYYKSCACGKAGTETFTDGTNLGHTGGTASCTEQAICDRCSQPYGALLAHVYDREIADDEYLKSEANCTDAAAYYHTCVCDKIGTTTFSVGTELGHEFATEYSSNRSYHYYPCTRKGCTEVKDRQQHTGGTPSCSEQAECDACGRSYGSVLDHDYEDEWYEYDENEHRRQCWDCDDWEYVPHTWDDGVVTKPATEEEDGEKLLTCYDCGATKTVVIPTLAHTHVFGDGWKWSDTQHWHECACTEKADAADHAWSEQITTPATCEQKGVKTLTCTVCGATKTEDTPMIDHTWDDGEITTEATEQAAGVKTYTCTVCGDTSRTEEIPVLEHTHKVTEGEWKWNDTQHWHECSCGEHSDVADHAWSEEITTPATCEQMGVKTLTCTVCGATKTEDTPMIDHTWDDGEITTEATEQAAGVKTYTCTSCGKATRTEDIPQLEPGNANGNPGNGRCIPSFWIFLLIILICLLLILLVFILFMRKNDRYR